MNKLAEQLSTDIAVRAAQKLASLNSGMEKDAGIKDILANPMAAKALAGGGIGAGIGALGGLANAYMSSDDKNPAGLGDYLTNALVGAGIGGGIGAGASGLMSYLGKNTPVAEPIMDPSRALNYNPAGATTDTLAKSRKPFDGLGDAMSEFRNNMKGFRDTLEGKDLASESVKAYEKLKRLLSGIDDDFSDAGYRIKGYMRKQRDIAAEKARNAEDYVGALISMESQLPKWRQRGSWIYRDPKDYNHLFLDI